MLESFSKPAPKSNSGAGLPIDNCGKFVYVSTQEPFIFSGKKHADDLQQQVLRNLALRLVDDTEYSREEIEKVSSRNCSVFPQHFAIDTENTDRLRLLSILSQSALPGEDKIRSHRPYLGPVIVYLKRIFWRVLKGHIAGSFEAIQEFNSLILYGHARQLLKLHELEEAFKLAQSENSGKRLV